MTDERINFTWGLDALDALGFVQVFNFMLRVYAGLGITRQEMLCLVHLSSYRYNVAGSESRPGLATIATEMGYSRRASASELVLSLQTKKMLIITHRPGLASIYDAGPFARACLEAWRAGSAAELGEGRTVDRTGSRTVDRTGVVRPTVHEEDTDERNKTKLPQRAAAADEGPQYVEIDEDGIPVEDSEPKLPKWRRPELPIHFMVLEACNAKRFPTTSGLKRKLTALAGGIRTGGPHGQGVYQACIDGMNGTEELVVPETPVPASWVPWRLQQARDHRWSVVATVRALFDRDALATHCNYHLNKMGVPVPKPALKEHEFPGATTYE